VAIIILYRGKCGLSKCITCYLMGMAVADLLVVISDPILRQIALIYFPFSFLSLTPVCRLVYLLVFAVTEISVWLTVAFTFDRFVAICCVKLKTKYCTERVAGVVTATVCVLSCLECLPWYFSLEPLFIFNNLPWFCARKDSFVTSPVWVAYFLFHRILTPCIPFFTMLLLNIITVSRILEANRIRAGLRGSSHGGNNKDTEMEQRKKSIVLLFSTSSSFILLWFTQVVYSIYSRVSSILDNYPDADYIIHYTGTMLQLLSSCTNTCIYVLTQAKFREEIQNGVKYPLKIFIKLVISLKQQRV